MFRNIIMYKFRVDIISMLENTTLLSSKIQVIIDFELSPVKINFDNYGVDIIDVSSL